jgi:phosphatidylserine decarboxylase
MKYAGRARKAAFKIILFTLIILAVLAVTAVLGTVLAAVTVPVLVIVAGVIWVLFSIFTLYFFRDPKPTVPPEPNVVVSPAHGKVDVIDTTSEAAFMGGECQRVSIFLSVFDVHVQNAPVSGRVDFFKYTTGQFLNAMRTDSATHNENVLLGFQAEGPRKIGVRLIAGVIARRIVPFVQQGEQVSRGDRISLIQFGSRADVYLPANAKIRVQLGDHVVGGQSILAALE